MANETLYVIKLVGFPYYKIGFTRCWKIRQIALGHCTPFETETIAVYKSPYAKELEEDMHRKYRKYHVRGEWFELPKDQVALIRSKLNESDFL